MDDMILSLLDSAGWYKNRNINIDYEIESLQREGFVLPNSNIIELLKEFWNLRIEFSLPSGEFSEIVLNIERAILGTDSIEIKRVETVVGKQLIPVGLLHFETGLLLVALDLSFYTVIEGEVYQIGTSFENFLDVTIRRKPVIKYKH